MLADPGFLETQLLGQEDRLLVLPQHVGIGPVRVVQRHHEEAQVHVSSPSIEWLGNRYSSSIRAVHCDRAAAPW